MSKVKNAELTTLLSQFNVKSEKDLFTAKSNTTERQERTLVTGKPNLVSMTADQCKKLCEKAGIEYRTGYEERVLEYITTNEAKDRYGDKVRAAGGDFKSTYYPDNPVVMYSHQYQLMPVGNTIKIALDKQNKAIPAQALFMDNDVDTKGFADNVFRVSKAGFMRACSIGFMVATYNIPETPEEREKLGLGKYGIEFLTWEYLEFSPCGIPANPQALVNYIKNFEKDISFNGFDEDIFNSMNTQKFFADVNILDVFREFANDNVGKKIISFPQLTLPADCLIVKDFDNFTVPEQPETILLEAKEIPAPIINVNVELGMDKVIDTMTTLTETMKTIVEQIPGLKVAPVISKPESKDASAGDKTGNETKPALYNFKLKTLEPEIGKKED